MKENRTLSSGVHLLSGIGVFFSAYGFWCLILYALLTVKQGEWISTICTVAVAVVSMVMRMTLTKTKLPPWSVDVFTGVLTAISAAGCGFFWFFVLKLPLDAAIAAGIMAIAAVLVGSLVVKRPPGMYAVMGIGGIQLLCFFIVRLSTDNTFPTDGFLWVFFLSSGCITAGANYRGIDRHMTRRGHSKTRLPGKVRRNNLLMIIGLYALGALVLLLRKPLVTGLKFLFWGIVLVIQWIFDLIVSLIPTKAGDGRQSFKPWLAESGAAEQATKNNGEVVFWIVIGACMLFLIAIAVRPLLEKLREKFAALHARIMRWLRKRSDAAIGESTGDYVDVTEEITGNSVTERKVSATGLRGWKREMRKFSRMPAGRDRFVEGYRLLLRGGTLRGVKLGLSDTPQETGEKMKPVLSGADMDAVTEQAEEIVFSGREADTDTAGLEAALEILKKKS